MSNKPLRVREKGALLQPPAAKPARAGPLARLKETLRRPRLRRAATQAGLGLCLLGLCAAYTLSLGDNATAVVAKKRELPIYSVQRDDKVLAISFDASWGADKTLSILDILDEHNVKTTFFLVGGWVDKYPDMVKEIAARGHEIGNHSDTHPHMSQLSESDIKDELRIMSDKVEKLTGVRPTLFRPPYGDYGNARMRVCGQMGLHVVQWSVDSLDWQGLSAEQIACRVQKAQSGDIILCHNNSDHITEALPLMLEWGKIKGLNFRPVGEVIYTDNYTVDGSGKQTQNKQ